MKRMLVALTLALLLSVVVGAGVASASHNGQPNPPKDFTTGGGKVLGRLAGVTPTPIEQKFEFSAHSDDADFLTADAKGHFNLNSELLQFRSDVTCLRVIANRAFFTAEIQKASNPLFEGRFVLVDVLDSDQPGGEGDRFAVFSFVGQQPFCFSPIFPALQVTSGNIVVHDGQPNMPGPNAAGALAEEPLQQRSDLGVE